MVIDYDANIREHEEIEAKIRLAFKGMTGDEGGLSSTEFRRAARLVMTLIETLPDLKDRNALWALLHVGDRERCYDGSTKPEWDRD